MPFILLHIKMILHPAF